jgi:hypothetical protein
MRGVAASLIRRLPERPQVRADRKAMNGIPEQVECPPVLG